MIGGVCASQLALNSYPSQSAYAKLLYMKPVLNLRHIEAFRAVMVTGSVAGAARQTLAEAFANDLRAEIRAADQG